MPFAAALSTNSDTNAALDEVCESIRRQLSGDADLGFVFFTPHHADEAEQLAATVQVRLGVACLLGCTGESIVGNEREIEWQPALSLWLAKYSQRAQLNPFHVVLEQTPDGYAFMGLPDSLAEVDPKEAALLLL